MKELVLKLADSKVILLTFAAFLILCALSNTVFQMDFTYLTQTLNYQSDQVYSLLESIGESGRTAHLLIFIADFLMVLLYSSFLIGANYNTFHHWIKNCFVITVLTFFPCILALIQLGEISVLAVIILNYQNPLTGAVHIANILTIMKHYLTVISFLLPIIGLCGKMVVKRNGRRMKNSA